MRFTALYQHASRPKIMFQSENLSTKCHIFHIKDKEVLFGSSDTELVAGEYVKNEKLFGPASKRNRCIIYPCAKHFCRIPCLCRICRRKSPVCAKALPLVTCLNCEECLLDYEDHETFHLTIHMLCKFCVQVMSIIPTPNFIVYKWRGFGSFDQYRYAYKCHEFEHCVWQNSLEGVKPICENCGKEFKNWKDLMKHVKSVHFK